MTETLTQALARRIRETPASTDDLRNAERYVRDWLGSLAAGGGTAIGATLRGWAADRRDLENRVFLAAALSHITETDDLHRGSTTHPGCVVVPVALLLGRELGSDGRALLAAVLAGYEAMLRIGEALGPAHYRVFHNTATAGVFGAAAAAASLLDLTADGWTWALGNAGTQAAGLWQFNADATMSKHLHAGHAAEAGLRAALLAAAGFTGPSAILEGEKGFFRGYCPDPKPERVLAGEAGWKLPETSFKPYPSCRHTHPVIDAALKLRHQIEMDAVRSILIATYPAALDVADRPAPTSSYAAQFSLQYCVATSLLSGRPGLSAFDAMRLESEPVVRLLERTRVATDPGLTEAYPERWGGLVEITLTDGEVRTARVEAARGDPEAPLLDEDLDAKVRDLCTAGGMDGQRIDELLAACGGMPAGGVIPSLPWLDAHEKETTDGIRQELH